MTSAPAPPAQKPLLLRVLDREKVERPPVWFMRQAGRSLPEYRELRTRAKDFVSFCLDPEMAAEATLQPMRRFAYDAAIVFADILLLPKALGQDVWFEAGEGPRLGELPALDAMEREVQAASGRLSAVGETLGRVRAELEPQRTLIGFAGGPWTVATYMLEGRGSDRSAARSMAFSDPAKVDRLVAILTEATARYLAMQIGAGAQAVQIFESWAELLPEDVFDRLVIRPHRRIVSYLREQGLDTPVIGFPRGAGALLERYASESGVQGVGLDVQAPATLGQRLQAAGVAIQGALDPLLLRVGGAAMTARIETLLRQWSDGPYIFNLGHGVLPDTPLENLAAAVAQVTAWRNG
jgi:uroporphyrinogen decarboxylase